MGKLIVIQKEKVERSEHSELIKTAISLLIKHGVATELSTDESIEERAKSKYPDAIVTINLSKRILYIESATEQSIIEQMKANEKKYKENRDTFETHHCGNILTEKEIDYDHCLQCGEYLQED